jgi:hypothetical protein
MEEARKNPSARNLGVTALAVAPIIPKGSSNILKRAIGKEIAEEAKEAGEKLLTREAISGANVIELNFRTNRVDVNALKLH